MMVREIPVNLAIQRDHLTAHLLEQRNGHLAADPVADIIGDMLQMTRAVADDGEAESEEEAWVEIVEYLRVAAQIVYEELADTRPAATP